MRASGPISFDAKRTPRCCVERTDAPDGRESRGILELKTPFVSTFLKQNVIIRILKCRSIWHPDMRYFDVHFFEILS